MTPMADELTVDGGAAKRAWRSPRLNELGNLRDFVRAGLSKSVGGTDNDAMAVGEPMNMASSGGDD